MSALVSLDAYSRSRPPTSKATATKVAVGVQAVRDSSPAATASPAPPSRFGGTAVSARSLFQLIELSPSVVNAFATVSVEPSPADVQNLTDAQINALGKAVLSAVSIVDLTPAQIEGLDPADYMALLPNTP